MQVKQKPNTNLIIVNYKGGYGGDFFCNILQKAIDPSHTFTPSATNQFDVSHKFGEWSWLKELGNLVQRHMDEQLNRGLDYSLAIRNLSWSYADGIYKICYDPDISVFANNVADFLKQKMIYPTDKVVVCNYHNTIHKNLIHFDLTRIFPQSKGIFLRTDSLKYHALFQLLALYKNDYKPLRKVARYLVNNMSPDIYQYNASSDRPEPFSNTDFAIDSGRLFFDMDIINKINKDLSIYLNCEIKLDDQIIKHYRQKNLDIINRTIGNVDDLSDYDVKVAVEKFLMQRYEEYVDAEAKHKSNTR